MRVEDIDHASFQTIKRLFYESNSKHFKRFCENMRENLQNIHRIEVDNADYGVIKHRTTIISTPSKIKLFVFISIENKGFLTFQNFDPIPVEPQKVYTFTTYPSPSFVIEPEKNKTLPYIFFKSF
jgi:hypothetical protein